MSRNHYPSYVAPDSKWLDLPCLPAVGFSSMKSPIPLKEHLHQGYELTYLMEGEVTWVLESGKKLHFTGNQFCLIQPNTRHRGEWDIIRPCKLFWILFEPSRGAGNTCFTESALKDIDRSFKQMGNRTKDADQYLVLYFEELVEALSVYEEKREDNLSQSENRSIVCRIIQRIARIILKTVIESNWSESDFIEKTMAIMKENINRDISMSDIADRLGIGVSTFSRKFKKETGMTPADSLQRLRCKEARRLFEEFPKISITELTFRVGFSNTQYFAKVFKKYTGMTPGGYKKSIRN